LLFEGGAILCEANDRIDGSRLGMLSRDNVSYLSAMILINLFIIEKLFEKSKVGS